MGTQNDSSQRSLFSSASVRVLLYLGIAAGFGIFFTSIMRNQESRYNRRLDQMENRRSTRMNMMRDNYKRADSIFREEQKRLNETESAKGAQ